MNTNPYERLAHPFSLEGYVAVITGGAGAIGTAAGHVFAHAGANVVLADLNGEGAEKAAAEISASSGRKAIGLKTDVTQQPELQALVDQTIGTFGKITTLVNNVGWGEYTPLWEIESDYMMKSYMLNCVSVYALTKLFVPHLQKQPNASVIMSNSMVGTTPSPEFLSYSNAKAALLNMVRSMAAFSGPQIRVNQVVIGSVDNGESTAKAGVTEEMQKALADAMVMKRRGTPWDIAYSLLYFASPAAAWITGATLEAHGGGSYKSKMPKA